jgi:hypothetical protein
MLIGGGGGGGGGGGPNFLHPVELHPPGVKHEPVVIRTCSERVSTEGCESEYVSVILWRCKQQFSKWRYKGVRVQRARVCASWFQ